MKIYLASSWRNASTLKHYIRYFRKQPNFKVDCFCDQEGGRTGFNIAEELAKAGYSPWAVNPITAFDHPAVADKFRIAFAEDKKWLDWCECCIMMMPCGKSAHLEGRYIKGQGKLLFLYWMDEPLPGEFDNMYQFADGLFYPRELTRLVETIKSYDYERKRNDTAQL